MTVSGKIRLLAAASAAGVLIIGAFSDNGEALARVKSPDPRERLAALEDPDPRVRGQAGAAIRRKLGVDFGFRADAANRREIAAKIRSM